jgi:hypothetical protein
MKEQEALLDETVTITRSQDGNYLIFTPSIEEGKDRKELAERDIICDQSLCNVLGRNK